MSQATLGRTPYRNSDLFAGYYLDERIDDLEGWDCDSEAENAFEALRELWGREGELGSGYKEDELLKAWIDRVLDVLGFDTQAEPTLPDGGGYNDRLLFVSAADRRAALRFLFVSFVGSVPHGPEAQARRGRARRGRRASPGGAVSRPVRCPPSPPVSGHWGGGGPVRRALTGPASAILEGVAEAGSAPPRLTHSRRLSGAR
jgi:hypothetical protein